MIIYGFLITFVLLIYIVLQIQDIKQELVFILMTQKEAVDALNTANNTLQKIGGETTTLLTLVADLQGQVANAANVSPELEAAVNAVVAQAKVVDDMVPDATPPATPTPPA